MKRDNNELTLSRKAAAGFPNEHILQSIHFGACDVIRLLKCVRNEWMPAWLCLIPNLVFSPLFIFQVMYLFCSCQKDDKVFLLSADTNTQYSTIAHSCSHLLNFTPNVSRHPNLPSVQAAH